MFFILMYSVNVAFCVLMAVSIVDVRVFVVLVLLLFIFVSQMFSGVVYLPLLLEYGVFLFLLISLLPFLAICHFSLPS